MAARAGPLKAVGGRLRRFEQVLKMSKSKVAVPSYLSAKARKLWRDIHTTYELEPEAVELLRVALENLDLGDRARELPRRLREYAR